MKLLPSAKRRFTITPDTKRALSVKIQLQRELARCEKAGLTDRDILKSLKAIRQEKQEVGNLCKSRGRAKGGGRSSKTKGRNAVVRVKEMLLKAFDLKEDDILVKATSMGGCDIHMSPHAQSHFPFAIEVKNVEKLSLWKALAQSTVNARKKNAEPVVFFKRAGSPMYVAFVAESLLEFLQNK